MDGNGLIDDNEFIGFARFLGIIQLPNKQLASSDLCLESQQIVLDADQLGSDN